MILHKLLRTEMPQLTGESIDFERHMTAPEIWLVLRVGFDLRVYFPGGENLFKLAIWQ